MPVEIRNYPVISELQETQSHIENIQNRLEDCTIAIHRNITDINNIAEDLEQVWERLTQKIQAVNYQQCLNNNRQRKFLIAALIYSILSTSAIIYLFLR